MTSRIMAAVKGSDTRPELSLRRELFSRGLRYRVRTSLIGRPDIVFSGSKVVCFVDGDRWHGNGWRLRGYSSFDDEFRHNNSEFWRKKITRNIERDQEVTERLRTDGWLVVRVWASDVERDVRDVADLIEQSVRARTMGV